MVCKHSHVVQVTSINQPSEVLPNDDNEPLEFEFQDLYEDSVFLARNNNEDSPHHSLHDEMHTSESPETAEYFARILQSTDRLTDLHDKKNLLKDKIHELLLLDDEADDPDGSTTAMRHVTIGIHSLRAMTSPQPSDTDFPVKKDQPLMPTIKSNHVFSLPKRKGLCQKDGQNHQRMKRDTCYGMLETVEVLHCGLCFKQDDLESSDMVEWIQCSTCNIWVHKCCVYLQ